MVGCNSFIFLFGFFFLHFSLLLANFILASHSQDVQLQADGCKDVIFQPPLPTAFPLPALASPHILPFLTGAMSPRPRALHWQCPPARNLYPSTGCLCWADLEHTEGQAAGARLECCSVQQLADSQTGYASFQNLHGMTLFQEGKAYPDTEKDLGS